MLNTTIAHYRITAKLGEGGMGEVYRATDDRLNRDVAIKLLPQSFSEDPARIARFQREAQVLASLNHPNIGQIYGLEEKDNQKAIVLELIEGPTLDERIATGPLPAEEAQQLALQITRALESAHQKGIIHRDLKPANVKVTPDGTVKVLDFGLAKAFEADQRQSPAHSPTLTAQATAAGIILGTAAYMSPEQAKGEPVDKRADIWAFGVVLFEMLAGRRLFDAPTAPETLAQVLTSTPDVAELPATVPAPIRRLLRRCLARDARNRLHDIADARIVLEEVIAGGAGEDEPATAGAIAATPPSTSRRILLAAAGLLLLAVAFAAGWNLGSDRTTAADTPRYVDLALPPGTHLALSGIQPGPPAVSPDGTRIAFAAEDTNGNRSLWVRDLAEPRAHEIADTGGASYPFWSRDGEHLGFFAEQRLKRVQAGGGTVLNLANAPSGKGGSWNADDTIVFSPAFNAPLYRIPANGGDPEQVTELEVGSENSHRFPLFLPDGRRFLFMARSRRDLRNRLMLGSLDGDSPKEIVETPTHGALAAGHLLFTRQGTLFAQPFDEAAGALTGKPRPIVENVRIMPGAARMVADAVAGTLVLQSGMDLPVGRLMWLDREGVPIDPLGEPANYFGIDLSPDGATVAATISTLSGIADRSADIWLIDAESGNRERFTFEAGWEEAPIWSPDGKQIAYSTDDNGPWEIRVKTVGGGGTPRTLVGGDDPQAFFSPEDWTPGGELIYFVQEAQSDTSTIWRVPVDGGGEPVQIAESTYRDPTPRVSPDGRWLVYGNSVDAGAPGLFVTSYPEADRRWQIPRGSAAWWSRDGTELFFNDVDGHLSAIEVRAKGDAFEWGAPRKLFQPAGVEIVGGDGARILARQLPGVSDGAAGRLELVLGWEALLRP